MDFSKLILIFKDLNDLNKGKKRCISAQDPRGCDVACKVTWQRHAGPRGVIFIFTYI